MGGEWRTARIDEVAERVAMGPFGSSIKVETFVPDGVPVISGQHLHGFKVDDSVGYNFITPEHAERLKNANVQRGDIIFTHAGNIGQVAYIPDDSKYDRYVISQRQFYMRCDRSKVIPEFVVAYFKTLQGQHKLLANTSQVGVPSIAQPVTYLRTIEIPLPPLPEQRAIARILGTLDDKIELNRRMSKTLEAMAQAIFKSWFVDFDPVVVNALRAGNSIPDKFAERAAHYRDNPDALGLPEHILRLFPDRFQDSELGPIPEGWEVQPIGDLVRCVGGATPSTKNPKYWEGGANPFLTPRDMASLDVPVVLDTERHITDAGVETISSQKLPVGTVLLSSRAPIGYLAINEVPVSVNQGIIAMICDGALPNYYVFFWVKNNIDVIKGKAGGTTFAEISKSTFRPIPALLPLHAILDEFMGVARPLFQKIVANSSSSSTLAELRDTLLPKLISGELRVPDVESFLKDSGL